MHDLVVPVYTIDAGGSRVVVSARSSIHDTRTVWSALSGTVTAEPTDLAGAAAELAVDMTRFDAGDFLKNRKLRKDFDMEANPAATFELTGVSEVVRDGAKFTAKARGTLRWRGKDVPLELAGTGTLDRSALAASASFELDIRKLGLQAPKFFVFKMEDVVTVEVEVRGSAAS